MGFEWFGDRKKSSILFLDLLKYEKHDLVSRVPNPKDKRSTLIKLTYKARDLRKYKPPIDSNKIDYFRDFSPEELKSLNHLLEKLSNSLES